MDEIKVKVSFKDEWQPRFYTVTGGEFTAMKDAIKAQPESRFDDINRVWSIKSATIAALKAAGYNVAEMPVARLRVAELSHRDEYKDGVWSRRSILNAVMERLNERGKFVLMDGMFINGDTDNEVNAALAAKKAELFALVKEYNAAKPRTREAFVTTFKKFNLKEASSYAE